MRLPFKYYITRVVKAGEHYGTERKPGEVSVSYDQKTWFYKLPRETSLVDFKHWFASTIDSVSGDVRIVGKYPAYTVEVRD